jgi:c-di-GMP-binding flagellar brake protein YcgR
MDDKPQTQHHQRRRYRRRKFSTPVGLWVGERFAIEKAVEISEGGALLRVQKPLETGRVYELQFFLPEGGFISAQAEVVYQLEPNTSEYYLGIRFINIPLRFQTLIREFVGTNDSHGVS